MTYTQDQLASALHHIEHGGLPSNITARKIYYELTTPPVLRPDPGWITQEDRETSHQILKAFTRAGGKL